MKSRRVVSTHKENLLCNVCNQHFDLETKMLKEHRCSDGIHITYFVCPHCGAKYITIITDPNLRKMIKRNGSHGATNTMRLRMQDLRLRYADRVKELS